MASAVKIGDQHTCQLSTKSSPSVPHVGGDVIGPGAPSILIENKNAAIVGDELKCNGGENDVIVTGHDTVLFCDVSAADANAMTEHKGKINSNSKVKICD